MGDFLLPIWSMRNNVLICSLNGNPSAIPGKALDYMTPAPFLLPETTSDQVRKDLDFTKYPTWYNPDEHWLAWVPTESLIDIREDSVGFAFDDHPVDLEDEYADVYYSSDKGGEPRSTYAGCRIPENWKNVASLATRKLHSICMNLAGGSDWYCRNTFMGAVGSVPEALDEVQLTMLHYTEDSARRAIDMAKRSVSSHLGFISWFQSIKELESSVLSDEDQGYVRSLRLGERDKAGVLFNVSRDYHEMNLIHLAHHAVPTHYMWTAQEKEDRRFLWLSPEYYNEFAVLRDAALGTEFHVEDFPSFETWKEDLSRTNWLFQNLKAGNEVPTWEYYIVDFHLFGARLLRHWETIQAYSERFHATVSTTPTSTVCTFFRQNPLRKDEPPFERPEPTHLHELTSFAVEEVGERVPEADVYYESTTTVLEQVKNLRAPRRGGVTAPLTGVDMAQCNPRVYRSKTEFREPLLSPDPLEMLDLHVGKEPSPEGIKDPLLLAVLASSTDPSPCLLPEDPRKMKIWVLSQDGREVWREVLSDSVRRGHSVHINVGVERVKGFHAPVVPIHDRYTRVDAPVLLTRNTWEPGFQTRKEAVDAILEWAPAVTDLEPQISEYEGLQWNKKWLIHAVLVCEDKRSLLRFKVYAAAFEGLTEIKDILEMGIRFGISFKLYIPVSKAREFADSGISLLERQSMAAMYAPGYVDSPIAWGNEGPAANYGVYLVSLFHLLKLPHAIAFVSLGGILRYIAEVYDKDIVHRWVRGPSVQVTEYNRGHSIVLPHGRDGTLYTSDQVSNRDIAMLLGHIPGKHPSVDTTLWPPPEVLESESGAFALFENLRNGIIVEQKYEWRTRAGWKAYLKRGSKGTHAPSHVPHTRDFAAGQKIFDRSFPEDWAYADVATIELPEKFLPPMRQD
ncbi:hypothetical protein B0H13DRAFT_1913574 [Mycena leptocephala]|nr:hypothetical protein B0H13DRAFT_1913574 [Mycena leptocephala]